LAGDDTTLLLDQVKEPIQMPFRHLAAADTIQQARGGAVALHSIDVAARSVIAPEDVSFWTRLCVWRDIDLLHRHHDDKPGQKLAE
jgi:hypothetical protein